MHPAVTLFENLPRCSIALACDSVNATLDGEADRSDSVSAVNHWAKYHTCGRSHTVTDRHKRIEAYKLPTGWRANRHL